MYGIQTLKEINKMENRADIPVIMVTSKNDKGSVVECQRNGICDYVLKPFDPDDLRKRIERAIINAQAIRKEKEEEQAKEEQAKEELQDIGVENEKKPLPDTAEEAQKAKLRKDLSLDWTK